MQGVPHANLKFLAAWVVMSVVANLTACSSIRTTGETGERDMEEFREYAETVFRLQNDVLNQLIDASELGATPTGNPEALVEAEARLVADCGDLNEAASITAQGQEPTLALKLRIRKSLPACEASARAAQTLLNSGNGNFQHLPAVM
jgi:hypothetical protein